MLTERRTFQAKVGNADAVVGKIKEMKQIFKSQGWSEGRIYTDYMSGKTDRVVWENDTESLGAYEERMNKAMGPEMQDQFQKWFSELVPLIESADVEWWQRQD